MTVRFGRRPNGPDDNSHLDHAVGAKNKYHVLQLGSTSENAGRSQNVGEGLPPHRPNTVTLPQGHPIVFFKQTRLPHLSETSDKNIAMFKYNPIAARKKPANLIYWRSQ